MNGIQDREKKSLEGVFHPKTKRRCLTAIKEDLGQIHICFGSSNHIQKIKH